MSEIYFRHLAARVDADIDLFHCLISIFQRSQPFIERPPFGLGSAACLPLLIQLVYRPLLRLGWFADISYETSVGTVNAILLYSRFRAIDPSRRSIYDVPGGGYRELNHPHTCVSSSR